MKDNKLEYTITGENRYRKEFIDDFFDILEKFDSMPDNLAFYFDVKLNNEGKTSEVLQLTYEEYKQNSIERAQKFKHKIFEEYGDFFCWETY